MGGKSMTPDLRLRFPSADIPKWSSCYTYADSTRIEAIGATASRRGWYSREEFLAVMLWKTQRTKSLCEQNTSTSIIAATRLALATDDERARIKALVSLRGIAFPTASTLLHFARPDTYPILDVRALWSLGVDRRPRFYSFKLWWTYVETCRSVSSEAGVSLRTLDRALWQFSKERQPSTVGDPPPQRGSPRNLNTVGTNKSETMRRLYAEGQSVAQVARSLGVAYGFAYGVQKRWREAGARAAR
jgi:hypothetical protein